MLTWEFNFNLGTIVPLIFAAGIFYAVTKADMKALKENVKDIKAALDRQTDTIAKQTETLNQIAVQNERINNIAASVSLLREDFNLLRRGEGWIQRDLDGQYPKPR